METDMESDKKKELEIQYPDSDPPIKKKDILVFLAFLLLTEGGGAIIGISTAAQIDSWWVGAIWVLTIHIFRGLNLFSNLLMFYLYFEQYLIIYLYRPMK